jgi:hypothetical protein
MNYTKGHSVAHFIYIGLNKLEILKMDKAHRCVEDHFVLDKHEIK